VGDRVPVGVDGRASARRAGGAVPARSRAGISPDGQLDGGDAPDRDGKLALAAGGGKRPFNEEYLALMRHFRMKPRTTEIGAKEQNGDVEASNGALKRRLEQALLRSREPRFRERRSVGVVPPAGAPQGQRCRGRRVEEELAAMRPLDVSRLPEFTEEHICVSEWSTIRVKHCAYSVPSRLIGETLRVRIYEDRIEADYAGQAPALL
jgi:hypothetical protein